MRGDELLHDLNDRLNGIMISVELAIRLHERQDAAEVGQILTRMREDCLACTDLVAELRQSQSGRSEPESSGSKSDKS